MTETIIPVFRVKSVQASATWYARLGFELTGSHQFEPGFPLYGFLRRGEVQIHLSEHKGDAPKKSLAYFWVDDVAPVSAEFGVAVETQPWGHEVSLTDPDGNRIRVAQPI
ncbi:MAG: VOC family protein [Actinomycetota bacterium]